MTHSFQFDPNSILGVPPGATLREIRDAYHQKSLKYHPDKGGDEWAFRLVARAYEILSTARVYDRAAAPEPARPSARPYRSPEPPPPPPRATKWADSFGPGAVTPPPPGGPTAASASSNLHGWSGERHPHDGMGRDELAALVAAELLILRFELECSLDLFARRPEDRNLSCTLHVAWPIDDLAEVAESLPGAAATLKRVAEAVKSKGVRKHAIVNRAVVEEGRFAAWLTYPTAVMASDALDALRDALTPSGLKVEKQVREMAIPRQWK